MKTKTADGETSESRDGAHMSFSGRIDTILNWAELNNSRSEESLTELNWQRL